MKWILSLLALTGLAVADSPNILLILSDDHSVPHLGSYGDPNCQALQLTPNLDSFASEGMRFIRAYTAAPQCAPSRTSIFAGRSPVGLGATRFSQPARADVPFFTDRLRENGYWAGLDGRHQHLEGRMRDVGNISETLVELGMKGPRFESRFDHFVQGASTKHDALGRVGERVHAALDQVPEETPFFLYYGFNQPHRKWGQDHEGIDPSTLVLPDDWPDLPEVRLDYARYLAEVRDLDTGFGRVMKVLVERGLTENTLVIFMGDNGEALLRGKGTLYTRGTHVPLIIRWPGKVAPGSLCEQLISGVDLAPTLLAAAGLEAAPGMTGQSFLPELLGNAHLGREVVFAERGWHFGPLTRTDGFDLSRSVTSSRYHFIYNAIPERAYGPVDMTRNNIAWKAIQGLHQAGELAESFERIYFQVPRPIFELYDLELDPYQLTNLSGQAEVTDLEADFRARLDEWMVRESDYLPLPTHIWQQMH